MKWDYAVNEDLEAPGDGLYVVCEGNFQYGNSTLSYYDPATGETLGEAFMRANGFKLGDVANSMAVHGGKGWIVVNNSHVVFAIDPDTFREVGRIENLTSPRYIAFASDTKAYVSQLWDNRIFIVDPSRYAVTGYIEVPDMTVETGSTEQMALWGKYLFVSCWSYQSRILKIDTDTDRIVGELTVGVQPRSLALDSRGKLWTITDGGYEGSPYGYEAPRLYRIDAESFKVEQSWQFDLGDSPSALQTDAAGDELYWLNSDVWRMGVDERRLPQTPVIPSRGTLYFGLTVSPHNGDIYVADAIDYQQPGIVYRYDAAGTLLDEFYVGVNPGAFCWK